MMGFGGTGLVGQTIRFVYMTLYGTPRYIGWRSTWTVAGFDRDELTEYQKRIEADG